MQINKIKNFLLGSVEDIEKSVLKFFEEVKGVAIFAKDFSGLPARKISKKLRDRQCLRLPRFVYGHLPFCKQFRPSGFRLRLHTYIRPQS